MASKKVVLDDLIQKQMDSMKTMEGMIEKSIPTTNAKIVRMTKSLDKNMASIKDILLDIKHTIESGMGGITQSLDIKGDRVHDPKSVESLSTEPDHAANRMASEYAKSINTVRTILEALTDVAKSIKTFTMKFSPKNLPATLLKMVPSIIPGIARLKERQEYMQRQRMVLKEGEEVSNKQLKQDYEIHRRTSRDVKLVNRELNRIKSKTGLEDEELYKTARGKELLDRRSELTQKLSTVDRVMQLRLGDRDHPKEQAIEGATQERKSTEIQTASAESGKELVEISNNSQTTLTEIKDVLTQSYEQQVQNSAQNSSPIVSAIESLSNIFKPLGGILSSLGNVLARFGGPVAAAAAVGYGIHKGAQAFSDSFGEGGFDMIQKMRKSDAISYGFGTTPHVDDWKQIEALPAKDIKTLIDTNEFEGNDLKRLQELYDKKAVETPAPSGIQSPNASLIQATKEAAFPAPQPAVGDMITGKSIELNEMKEQATGSNKSPIIAAPTVNNVNSSTVQNQSIQLPSRNLEPSVNRFIVSRFQ